MLLWRCVHLLKRLHHNGLPQISERVFLAYNRLLLCEGCQHRMVACARKCKHDSYLCLHGMHVQHLRYRPHGAQPRHSHSRIAARTAGRRDRKFGYHAQLPKAQLCHLGLWGATLDCLLHNSNCSQRARSGDESAEVAPIVRRYTLPKRENMRGRIKSPHLQRAGHRLDRLQVIVGIESKYSLVPNDAPL